jgi:hypothetical protein
MLTKEQLLAIARKNNVPLFTQERDYVQSYFFRDCTKITQTLYSKEEPV